LAADLCFHSVFAGELEGGCADVNAQGGFYGNALQAASWRGHAKTVQQLLEHGADVNAQGGYCGNALQAASATGHVEIVRQLLERGADVNAQGGYYGTAPQAAAAEGMEKVVAMLLEKGADYADSDRSSDASSLWCGSNSEGSSATSELPSENIGLSMQRLADVVLDDAGLATTLTAAMSHPSLQSDKVLEEFKRLMGYYYKDLKKSSTITDHDRVARLVKKSSGIITNEARRLLGLVYTAPRFSDLRAKMSRQEENEMLQNLLRRTVGVFDEPPPITEGLTGQHQETGIYDDATGWEDDNEDEEGLEDDVYPEISAAVAFLKDGIPMQKFQANLRKFVLDAVLEYDVLQSPKCLPRSLPNMVDDIWGRLRLNLPERRVPRGKRRIRWTCVSRTCLYYRQSRNWG
jgi:hypothetical protein